MKGLAPPLQQIERTYVLHRGRKLTYFAGCDYFRLGSHPVVLNAVREGLHNLGLNVAASRKTTGNHLIYQELEDALARFFAVPAAVLVSSGYATNLVVAQSLAGEFTHALIDERAHGSLCDAAKFLDCRVIIFPHRDVATAARTAKRLGPTARPLLLTDGLYSHSGEVAPLDEYLRRLPPRTTFLVDDAHGIGTLGRRGRGSVEHLGVPTDRIIQTMTLSKAFGAYGGAVLCSAAVREKIIRRSRFFVGNTPLPPPLAMAALASLRLFQSDSKLRRRLVFNTNYVKAALREAGLPTNTGPGPIIPLRCSPRDAARLKRALFVAGIHPPFINYLGGANDGYFRFAISSEHTAEQLDTLLEVLRSRWRR